MLVDKQLSSLYNGVSQQPPTVRLPSQAEDQINGLSTVVDGVRKRPPSEMVAQLSDGNMADSYVHTINRDSQERYIVVVTDGRIRVFDFEGVERVVNLSAPDLDYTYLQTDQPRDDFVCVTVADYTFVLNRRRVVRISDVDGNPGSSTVAQPVHRYTMIPSYPGDSVAGVNESTPFGGGYRGQRARQKQYSANASGTLVGTVQSFQDLPTGATSGDIYKVEGTADSGFATYYVRSAGDNVWNECVKPGLRNRIDAATMPHALVRKDDGTFEFGEFSWADRKVGDETTNPNPTFVAREIRDLFWYKNRLGFAVDEGVVLSRVGDFGNFYRLTVVDLLDDEVVDVQASETQVTKINYAVPFNEGIILFSDQTQLKLAHGDALTPKNATLDVVTNYKMQENVRPFAIGSDVYFPTPNGEWSVVREYFVRDQSNSNDAANVTAHVPAYVPVGVRRLSGSDTHDMLLVLTGRPSTDSQPSEEPNSLFVYKFYWTGSNEKVQSAWSRWDWSTDNGILWADVLDSSLYIMTHRSDGTFLERLGLEPTARPDDFDFQIYLDRRVSANGNYDVDNDATRFRVPYAVASDQREFFALVHGGDFGDSNRGAMLSIEDPDEPGTFILPEITWLPGAANLVEFFSVGFPGENIPANSVFITLGSQDTQNGAFATAKGSAVGAGGYYWRTGSNTILYLGGVADVEPQLTDPIEIAIVDNQDATIAAFLAALGQGEDLEVKDFFSLTGTDDTANNGFAAAKGSPLVAGDFFIVTSSTTVAFFSTAADIDGYLDGFNMVENYVYIDVDGNHTELGGATNEALMGLRYRFEYEFSEPFITNRENVPVLTGSLQVRTYTVYFKDTAFFQTDVRPHGVFTNYEAIVPSLLNEGRMRTAGESAFYVDAPEFRDGSFQFQVYGDSKSAVVRLVNDSPWNCTFTQAEYEGFYNKRSRSI